MGAMSQLDHELQIIRSVMGEPCSEPELAEDHVARVVRDAFLATSELYKLRLNPKTAALVAREEGELWAIQSRVTALLNEIRADHVAA